MMVFGLINLEKISKDFLHNVLLYLKIVKNVDFVFNSGDQGTQEYNENLQQVERERVRTELE